MALDEGFAKSSGGARYEATSGLRCPLPQLLHASQVPCDEPAHVGRWSLGCGECTKGFDLGMCQVYLEPMPSLRLPRSRLAPRPLSCSPTWRHGGNSISVPPPPQSVLRALDIFDLLTSHNQTKARLMASD